MTELVLKQNDLGSHYVYTNTGVDIGVFVMDVDGYYYYWPNRQNDGAWAPWMLRDVADKLDEVNKPWDDIVQTDQTI
jgi:hypothetical protein